MSQMQLVTELERKEDMREELDKSIHLIPMLSSGRVAHVSLYLPIFSLSFLCFFEYVLHFGWFIGSLIGQDVCILFCYGLLMASIRL